MADDRRAAAKERRVQQVKRQKRILAVIGVVILIAVCAYIVKSCGKDEETSVAEASAIQQVSEEENSQEVEEVDKAKTTTEEKSETAKERLKRVKKEAKEAGYPEDVIELLSKNSETVDFVENYGELKDSPAANEIEELVKGEIPQLLQWDARWGYAPYGTSIVAVCGCGPTCLSMVLSGLTGDKSLTPAKIAEYGTENHYISEENDTYWRFMTEAGDEWTIECKEKFLDEEELKKELKAGHPAICSVGPGDFTKIGHFIVLAGYEDGKVIVHDPFSQKNSDKRWEYEDFKDQIKSMWIYSAD